MKKLKFETEPDLCSYLEENLWKGNCGDVECDECYTEMFKQFKGNVTIEVPEEIEVTQNYKLLKNGKMVTWIYRGAAPKSAPESLIESWDKLGMYVGCGYDVQRTYKVREDEVTLDVAWEMK